MDKHQLFHRFKYHPPRDGVTIRAHEKIRQECHYLADIINREISDGREKSLAITKIEEAMMWANAAIARNGHSHSDPSEDPGHDYIHHQAHDHDG